MKIINFGFWKRLNRFIVIQRIGLPEHQIEKGPATVYCFKTYRDSLSEDKRWVKHYLWWSGLIHEAKKRRSAKMRASNNHGLGPRRR